MMRKDIKSCLPKTGSVPKSAATLHVLRLRQFDLPIGIRLDHGSDGLLLNGGGRCPKFVAEVLATKSTSVVEEKNAQLGYHAPEATIFCVVRVKPPSVAFASGNPE